VEAHPPTCLSDGRPINRTASQPKRLAVEALHGDCVFCEFESYVLEVDSIIFNASTIVITAQGDLPMTR